MKFPWSTENRDHLLAHEHCSEHRAEIERSELCGCFYCMAVFPPGNILAWHDA